MKNDNENKDENKDENENKIEKDNIQKDNGNELLEKQENIQIDEGNNLISLIIILENGNKFDIKADKNETLQNVIEKVIENEEEYNNLEKLSLFDGENEITDRVKNGEIISSFGFNEEHVIQIKLKDN